MFACFTSTHAQGQCPPGQRDACSPNPPKTGPCGDGPPDHQYDLMVSPPNCPNDYEEETYDNQTKMFTLGRCLTPQSTLHVQSFDPIITISKMGGTNPLIYNKTYPNEPEAGDVGTKGLQCFAEMGFSNKGNSSLWKPGRFIITPTHNSSDLVMTLQGRFAGAIRFGTNLVKDPDPKDPDKRGLSVNGLTTSYCDAERMTIYNCGRVGIGTAGLPVNYFDTPAPGLGEYKANSMLHIHDPLAGANKNILSISGPGGANDLGINFETFGLQIKSRKDPVIHYGWDNAFGNYLDMISPKDQGNQLTVDKLRVSNTQGFLFYTSEGTGMAATEKVRITKDGKLGIGVSNPKRELVVNGTACMKEVFVQLPPTNGQPANDCWYPDYVFEKDYKIMPLVELEKYVRTEKHLPNVPSSEDVQKAGGVPIGTLQVSMLKQLEELTLHVIEQNKRIEELEKRNKELLEKLTK